jgi:predicted nuclease of restriction endonuclease-like (RecB) superfamily
VNGGDSVVEFLSRDLQLEFSGVKGFSPRNLWNMKNYFSYYKNLAKLQTLSAEIPWSHNILILEKCKITEEREFYITNTIKMGWLYRTLEKCIKENIYESHLKSQTNFAQTLD